MTKKIALIGTHSGGKTTSAHTLMGEIKIRKHTAEFVPESAREALAAGFKLDGDASDAAQEWMFHNQVCNELQASIYNPDYIVTDRSVLDGLAYIIVNKGYGLFYHRMYQQIFTYSREHFYDYMIYFPPLAAPPQADGVRATNLNYQIRIHQAFMDLIDNGTIDAEVVKETDKVSRRDEAINMVVRRFNL